MDEAVKNLREAFEALTKISYAVIAQDLKGVTSDAPKQVQVGSDLTVQLTADSGYLLPVSVTLSPAEAFQDAAYDADTGILTLQGVTGDLTIAAEGVPFAYADVAETHWFYDEVAYVTRWGLMNGMENNRFYPNNSMSQCHGCNCVVPYGGFAGGDGHDALYGCQGRSVLFRRRRLVLSERNHHGRDGDQIWGRQHGQPPAGGYVPVPPC